MLYEHSLVPACSKGCFCLSHIRVQLSKEATELAMHWLSWPHPQESYSKHLNIQESIGGTEIQTASRSKQWLKG